MANATRHWITKDIEVRGAREHNLRNVNVKLPRGSMICFTGVSGSGKSSLAFDTLYAEGQRRYIESLSSYARQFVGQLPKPDVDYLSGLSPAISISQKTTGTNPRSTVGTITEINDFLRVLYARVGTGFCPDCNVEIKSQTRDQIVARVQQLTEIAESFVFLAPIIRGQKGEYKDLFEELRKQGFARARIDGEIYSLAEPPVLERQIRHHIEVVVDRVTLATANRSRIAEAVDIGLRMGEGTLLLQPLDKNLALADSESLAAESSSSKDSAESKAAQKSTRNRKSKRKTAESTDVVFSAQYSCPKCARGFVAPSPQMLSFNSPQGLCRTCDGLGELYTFQPELLIPDEKLSLRRGAIKLLGKWTNMSRWMKHQLQGVADSIEKADSLDKGVLLKTAWKDLPEKYVKYWLHGTGQRHITFTYRGGRRPVQFGGTFEGIIPLLLSQWNKSNNPMQRRQYEKYMHTLDCSGCGGQRLNPQARALRLRSTSPAFERAPWKSLPDVSTLPLDRAAEFFADLDLSDVQQTIAGEALKEIRARIGFLLSTGLSYLSLSRTAPTLSGGESQRIRLASQIGSGLVGVLYVLDEPSIGLHPRDNDALLASLKRLRDLGNTLIVVEHDEDTMRQSDLIVDFGPGPGVKGGELVVSGSLSKVQRNKKSLTGGYLSGRLQMDSPEVRRTGNGQKLVIRGARHNNLKNIDVEIPLGTFVVVTGVSGSGKSSLITDILTPALRRDLNGAECEPGLHDSIEGVDQLDKIIDINQSPIGRTPRSNPATYVKVFDLIRDLFAQMPEAKRRGFAPGRFSFNTEHGRCSACEGNGSNRLEMEFLADLWVPCPVCNGARYDRETLQVKFKDKSIADCLDMDVQQALQHFENVPKIAEKLQTVHDVGLDYLKLGQPSPTLSGGEAQRIKLSKELSRRSTSQTLYVLDEPTTGLHFADVNLLLKVLQSLVDKGNTVVVVEHNQGLIQAADWIIDLGPEGGAGGGQISAMGTPETIAKTTGSHTGKALAEYFDRSLDAKKTTTKSTKKTASPNRLQAQRKLSVGGATQHNLKDVSVDIGLGEMTVFCGHSGSGKTSLAMDTIYAEGQRRYTESLSAYARQFIGQMPKPTVERIEGLSPAVAIEQRNMGHTPRSTVGTVTEIYDYMRVLMARLATMVCPDCNIPVGTQTTDQIVDTILTDNAQQRILVLAPIDASEIRDWVEQRDLWQSEGFIRLRIDGTIYPIADAPEPKRTTSQTVQIVVDRVRVAAKDVSRLSESIESALTLGGGVMQIAIADANREETRWEVRTHSRHISCSSCNRSFDALTPHSFSFNTSLGWCETCEGLGTQVGTNPAALIDPNLSLIDGGLLMLASTTPDAEPLRVAMITALCHGAGLDPNLPVGQMTARERQILFQGTDDQWHETKGNTQLRFQYRGIFPAIAAASRQSPTLRAKLDQFVSEIECQACQGARVREEAAAARFYESTIVDLVSMPLGRLLSTVTGWKLAKSDQQVAGELLQEVTNRLTFLVDVGLEYLSLSRGANSLSGGESQRIRLASQLGSGLCGVLYVLDEPTIGLHPRDNHRLVNAMHRLRDLGNTLIVVEHDRDVIASADRLCDFGPGSGRLGGEIVAEATPRDLVSLAKKPKTKQTKKRKTKNKSLDHSVTLPYLAGQKSIPVPSNRRIDPDVLNPTSGQPDSPQGHWLTVVGARENTLRTIDVAFPLGAFTTVTGPSGSGKSSLVNDILYPALGRRLHRLQVPIGAHTEIVGLQHVDKVVQVDQSPLGMSPSSNPATYTGAFDLIRQLYARLPDAKLRGFTPRQFSFNVPGGRCEKCEGNGQCRIEMHFLPDVWVECEACHGRRYTEETLSVKYHGQSIYDLLNLPIGDAYRLLENIPKLRRILQTLVDVGLDYLTLGQPAPTLSGGEAQRVKLAAELSRPETGQTIYLLDEPTTGLHFDDIQKLINVMHRLVDVGNSVVVIEHNLDVIKQSDWVIDMGPEAGWGGGEVVVAGTPEHIVDYARIELAKKNSTRRSYTGEALEPLLANTLREHREPYDVANFLKSRESDLSMRDIESQSQAPWESNGRKWHLENSLDRKGEKPQWDRRALQFVVDKIESSGYFDDVDFNSRSIVEAAAPVKSDGWFLHAVTAETWTVNFKFRVPRGNFRKADLLERLDLPRLSELSDVPAYSNAKRCVVRSGKDWQEVELRIFSLAEIQRPKIASWIDEAIKEFASALHLTSSTMHETLTQPGDTQTTQETAPNKTSAKKKPRKSTGKTRAPSKESGDASPNDLSWHVSEAGLLNTEQREWDPTLIESLVEKITKTTGSKNWDWSDTEFGILKKPNDQPWLRLHTKKLEHLMIELEGTPDALPRWAIAEFGGQLTFLPGNANSMFVRVRLKSKSDVRAAKLTRLLKSHYGSNT